MSEAAIRFSDVSHRYGSQVALEAASLAVPSGCLAGLIGPDGVGKSTLLGLSAGIIRCQTGRIEVLGGDMEAGAHRRDVCARIAFMPQGLGRNLYPTLSVAENLDFFGRLFGQHGTSRKTRIDALLEMTGLKPFAGRPAGQLSGGMKQKLGICASLLHDPDLLILDEPTTGIDPLSRLQFWSLIDAIRARRPEMSVLVATAYMEEAARFDWLAAMHGGRVLATGKPEEILTATGSTDLEAAFVALMPPPPEGSKAVPVEARPLHVLDGPPAIEAEGLTRRFGTFTAVDRVSFRIARGEIFGFLGSNGSGKSTTMKMLTGLLAADEGTAKLFGQVLRAGDIETRKRVGYMSQAFSLYGELTVRQNLMLHARLFDLPPALLERRVAEVIADYALAPFSERRPDDLPLGIRQRLQLAAAVIHRPEILILDEPTSGVDPQAREAFWASLIKLSRQDGVTIFLSTHFMNEAERCDRISLMHAGRLLAVDTPAALCAKHGKETLEQAFIEILSQAGMGEDIRDAVSLAPVEQRRTPRRLFDGGRLMAYARREILEILRDRARLVFALAGPLLLMLTFGYGISFDVENLPFAVLDLDRSAQSRQLVESLQGSRYFREQPPLGSLDEMQERLEGGKILLGIEIPPDYGRDLMRQLHPQLSVWLDGSMPFRAETARGYLSGLLSSYLRDEAARHRGRAELAYPAEIESRFRYNQDFKSANAIVPSVIMLMLVLIPAIMTALGIVKEKETGSIVNFQATPATRLEFLLGKQLPYIGIAFVSFLLMVAMMRLVFGVVIKGSFPLLALGSLLYICATTAFGLFLSSFVRSQMAAIFATAIVSVIPSVNFSGLLVPVSALSGGGRLFGLLFPAAWYQPLSVGVITKGLGISVLWVNLLALIGFALAFVAAALVALRKRRA